MPIQFQVQTDLSIILYSNFALLVKKNCDKEEKCCGGCKSKSPPDKNVPDDDKKSSKAVDERKSSKVLVLYGTTTGTSKSFSEVRVLEFL